MLLLPTVTQPRKPTGETMTPEQRLADAEAARERAVILCNAVWKETERQRNAVLYAYDAISVVCNVAKDALAGGQDE